MTRYRPNKMPLPKGTRLYGIDPPRETVPLPPIMPCPLCGRTSGVGIINTDLRKQAGVWYHCRQCYIDYSELGDIWRFNSDGEPYIIRDSPETARRRAVEYQRKVRIWRRQSEKRKKAREDARELAKLQRELEALRQQYHRGEIPACV